MRRLILGGSFNPIHHGHLICGRAVAERLGYDRVVLIPSAQPPHKPNTATLADARHRLSMTQLAVAGDPLFEVDELELQRIGPSYTVDTANELIQRGWTQIDWLIGADMLLYLPNWHRPTELLAKVNLIVMARPGFSIDWDVLAPEFRALERNVVEAPHIDISATGIRARVGEGKSIRYLTPEPVQQYIVKHGLYLRT